MYNIKELRTQQKEIKLKLKELYKDLKSLKPKKLKIDHEKALLIESLCSNITKLELVLTDLTKKIKELKNTRKKISISKLKKNPKNYLLKRGYKLIKTTSIYKDLEIIQIVMQEISTKKYLLLTLHEWYKQPYFVYLVPENNFKKVIKPLNYKHYIKAT